jgi:uncharacterized protein (TIGR00730 family)
LVYGGGNTGLMGAVANGSLAAGGKVIGVMPQHIIDLGLAHAGLTEFRKVDSMHDRKKLICELADGFVALPGGIGTMEELFEVATWGHLHLHQKPCGLLNAFGFFDHLVAFLGHMADEGFLARSDLGRLVVAQNGERLLANLF